MMEANMNSEFKQTPLESFDRDTIERLPVSYVKQSQGCRAMGGIDANATVPDGSHVLSAAFGAAGIILLIGGYFVSHAVAIVLASGRAFPGAPAGGFLEDLLLAGMVAGAAVFAARRISTSRPEGSAAKQIAQYRFIAPLGRGGMGEVYLAEHRLLKRPCAIKLVRPERTGDAQVVARFDREVRMTARLSHRNVVTIFDYGRTDDGTLYYVMEYLPGLSLEEILQVHGRQPAERVVHLMRQACQALREAHSMGLIHRDVKPANLFAAQCGGVYDVLKVLDFGLVKPVAEVSSARLTQECALTGTPLFMSPEQATGSNVDRRSDIYSLGAVAYALLSGRPPFERRSSMEVLMAHARDEVTPLSESWRDAPADLERVVLRCLAKRPDDRYQDMDDLERALARCSAAEEWSQSRAACWWAENARGSLPPDRENEKEFPPLNIFRNPRLLCRRLGRAFCDAGAGRTRAAASRTDACREVPATTQTRHWPCLSYLQPRARWSASGVGAGDSLAVTANSPAGAASSASRQTDRRLPPAGCRPITSGRSARGPTG
jgi:serine/threonine protein kinase